MLEFYRCQHPPFPAVNAKPPKTQKRLPWPVCIVCVSNVVDLKDSRVCCVSRYDVDLKGSRVCGVFLTLWISKTACVWCVSRYDVDLKGSRVCRVFLGTLWISKTACVPCVSRYVVDLKGSRARLISEMWRLQSQQWIDERTRAVFIEFSLFNAQVNLFVGCTIVAEFGPDGKEATGMFKHGERTHGNSL